MIGGLVGIIALRISKLPSYNRRFIVNHVFKLLAMTVDFTRESLLSEFRNSFIITVGSL